MFRLILLAAVLTVCSLYGKELPKTTVGFKKVQLSDKYYTEGASMADVNADGHMDVIAGPLWWDGPDFKKSHSYYPVKEYSSTSGYANNFFTFPDELTKDKWMDIIKVGLPSSSAEIAVNPGEKPFENTNQKQSAFHRLAQKQICNESPQYVDVIGDEKKEILAYSHNHITLAQPGADITKPWTVLNISPRNGRFRKYEHGLGAGDVNGDGLQDILEKSGWWEQPKNWDKKTPWKYHAYNFVSKRRGGAQMFAYDIDGDGDNDVVTSHDGHGYGMSWHEQISKDGKITFKQHIIMTDKPEGNPYGVCFSQLHAMDCVDIDGDGIKDIVTGKCYNAHNGKDPGAKSPSVLYWFKTQRNKDGSAELVPYLIDDNSGVGRQLSTGDLNKDGKMDIVVGNKKGVFAFIQEKVAPGSQKQFPTQAKVEQPKPKKVVQTLGDKQTFHASVFKLTGPRIKYGGDGRIGWWFTKDSYASLPISIADSKKKGASSKKVQVLANISAGPRGGGIIKLVLTKKADPNKDVVKSWLHPFENTGSWAKFKLMDLGSFELEKAGDYYLHFIMHKANDEFMDIRNAILSVDKSSKFQIKGNSSSKSATTAAPKKKLKGGNNIDLKAKTASEQLSSFTLPEGFGIELVSSEEQGVIKPISINFDDKGRLWTQTAKAYPADKNVNQFRGQGPDAIIYLDTPWGKGPQSAKVFADGLTMPNSVLWYNGTIYAVHGPDLIALQDTDGDGKADKKRVLATGFGIQDTHTNIHNLARTPDNWITFSQGCNCSGNVTLSNGSKVPFNNSRIARINTRGSQLQTLATGMNNIWCWGMSREGRTFIHEANDLGYSQVPYIQDSSYPSFRRVSRYKDSFLYPPVSKDIQLGGTGFSGITVSEDEVRGFPAEWRGVNFVANPITGKINTVSYTKDPNSGEWKFKKMPDLVSSTDGMFRPVQIEFGPDGCLYIIDWYNRIISHNEVSTSHPSRDKVSGRIWRVRHKSQKAYSPIDMTKVATKDLINHLKSTNPWEYKAAWHQIVDRNAKELIPALEEMIKTSSRSGDKVVATWCLSGLKHFDKSLWENMLADGNENVRYEAIRSLSSIQPGLDLAHSLLKNHNEKSYYVLYEITRFYRNTPNQLSAEHVSYLDSLKFNSIPNKTLKGWKGTYKALGGAYEQSFVNFLVEKAKKQDRGQDSFNEQPWNKTVANFPADKAKQAEVKKKVHSFTAFHKSKGGDLNKGKVTFQAMCAVCHDPSKGSSAFAPALNGGKNRAAEGIITAVLDPHAAIETAFQSYKVTKKDGSVVEGFRSNINEKEITLMFMGGGTVKIPLTDVKQAGYVSNKSVMPEFGAAFNEKSMADLIEYIQSMK